MSVAPAVAFPPEVGVEEAAEDSVRESSGLEAAAAAVAEAVLFPPPTPPPPPAATFEATLLISEVVCERRAVCI